MRIITISGLDGSGKSTQIQMLKKHLEQQGSKVFYFHAIEQGIAKKLVDFKNKYCLICKMLEKCKTKQEEKSVTKSSWLGIWMRKIFLRIDIWQFNLLRNQLRNKNFDYILSDRFFYDSIINISYLENSKIENCKLIENLKLKIENLKSFYLDINPDNIMQRERTPDQGIEYLKKKKELYDAKISLWNLKKIDGNREKNIILENIVKLLNG